jgi:hypothetical protein
MQRLDHELLGWFLGKPIATNDVEPEFLGKEKFEED